MEQVEEELNAEDCCDFDDGRCDGQVKLRPGIRLANVEFAYCEYHWQRRLATADWEGVHEQQRHLGLREGPPEEEED